MKDLGLTLMVPLSVLIVAIAVALLIGTEGWLVVKTVVLCVPIMAYTIFSIFTVIWSIKIGEVGLTQSMTLQARIYFWHGVSVVLVIILSAAGSFILLFAHLALKGF